MTTRETAAPAKEKRYMLIDVTSDERTRIVAVGTIRSVPLLAKICSANDGGTFIGPPLEGRGFSKVGEMALKYLYWNTFGLVPSDDYNTLLNDCKQGADAIVPDSTPLEVLEAHVKRLYPDEPTPSPDETTPDEATAEKPSTKRAAAPKKTGVSKRVWEIADSLCNGSNIPSRTQVVEAALAEGINKATAGTQYSRWKASKN